MTKSETTSEYFRACLRHSYLVGGYYLSERRTKLEKVFWIVAILVTHYLCFMLIYWKYLNWLESPLIYKTVEERTLDTKFGLPAITVCPVTKFDHTKFNIEKYMRGLTIDFTKLPQPMEKYMDYYAIICKDFFSHVSTRKTYADTLNYKHFVDTITRSRTNFFAEDVVCFKNNKKINCSNYFQPILLREGFCYTYNTLSEEVILRKSATLTGYQDKVKDYGDLIKDQQVIIRFMSQSRDLDYRCMRSAIQGFKVLVRPPSEIPDLYHNYAYLSGGTSTSITIETDVGFTADELYTEKPDYRNCHQEEERHLRYYNAYTESNCIRECFSNFTQKACGCVAFYMPRLKDMIVCGSAKMLCVERVYRHVCRLMTMREKNHYTKCKCLPDCTWVQYKVHAVADLPHTEFRFHWKNETYDQFMAKPVKLPLVTTQMIVSMLPFKGTATETNDFFNLTDLLISFGGLICFFTGLSIIAVAQTCYFMTLRVLYNKIYHGSYWRDKFSHQL